MLRDFYRWTRGEKEQLRVLYVEKGLGSDEISQIMKRSNNSINIKRKRMNFRHTEEQTLALKSRNMSGSSNPMFGKIGPNRGLTKETSDRIRIAGEKLSKIKKEGFASGQYKGMSGPDNPRFGTIPWSKGLTKSCSEKLRVAASRQSATKKENWLKLSEEEKERRRRRWAMQSLKRRFHRSSIEIKVEALLSKIGIQFFPAHRMNRFILDFWIPSCNLCLECNGDYWHCNPKVYAQPDKYQKKNIDRDQRKAEMLARQGFNIVTLWELDINKNVSLVERIIMDKINELKERLQKVKESPVKVQRKPVLSGIEIMQELGIKPDDRKRLPEIGKAQKLLLEIADEYASEGKELTQTQAVIELRLRFHPAE
jgi:G:T-mismatch repair DNA endonuclease (very short patch repair protein)